MENKFQFEFNQRAQGRALIELLVGVDARKNLRLQLTVAINLTHFRARPEHGRDEDGSEGESEKEKVGPYQCSCVNSPDCQGKLQAGRAPIASSASLPSLVVSCC